MAEGTLISGRYRVERQIGQGGFAVVYRGVDTETGQIVAVKQLKHEVIAVDPDIVARFAREGDALRRLNHPNIVKVLATEQQTDESYVVMEFVGGGDLRDLLDNQRKADTVLPLQRVLEIALDLSDALTRAHRLRIVHRDIKPANVLLAEDGTPRLTDFGVAHFSDSTRMTQSGTMIGTIAYLSPEACAGEDVDQRADIWSFGVMLYEMLTGQRPFQENNTAAMLTAILSKTPTPPSDLRREIPPELDTLVMQMLVKDPDERLSSVRLVGAQVEAMLSGAEVPASIEPTPTPESAAAVQQELLNYLRANKPTPPLPDAAEAAAPVDATTASGPPTAKTAALGRRLPILLGVGALGLIVVVLALGLLLLSGTGSEGADDDVDTVAVVPVAPGKQMVLVARLVPLGEVERDIAGLISQDLNTVFAPTLPFSLIEARTYPEIIEDEDEARSVAAATGAAVIVWGNYDADVVELQVQMGDDAWMDGTGFMPEDLRTITDARLRLSDPRQESIAASVVAVLNASHSVANDAYAVSANLAVLDLADLRHPEVIGSDPAAYWHRFLQDFHSDPTRSLVQLDAAIDLAPQQPILYMARTLALVNVDPATPYTALEEEINTAEVLGPEGWPLPTITSGMFLFMREGDVEAAYAELATLDAFALADWWTHTIIGAVQGPQGDYADARLHLEAAVALDPPANFPYVYLSALAFREGDLAYAQQLMLEVQREFPDPTLAYRLLDASYGTGDTPINLVMEAFGNAALERWSLVLDATQRAQEQDFIFNEIYLLEGFAHCNRQAIDPGSLALAEASYSRLIEAEPGFMAVYLLRAEVRLAQGDGAGAAQDLAAVLSSEQADMLQPYIDTLGTDTSLSCTNFMDYDFSAISEGTG